MFKKLLYSFMIMAMVLGIPSAAFAQGGVPPLPDASGLAVTQTQPVQVASSLVSATGEVQIVVRLQGDPVTVAVGEHAKEKGSVLTDDQQKSLVASQSRNQDVLIKQIEALGGKQIARIKYVLNAVIFSIDASKIGEVAKLTNVATIRSVVDYQLDLSETVPYIGASFVQNTLGYTGTGVRVAVLDSGIDYTHFYLGGSGNVAEYNANNPDIIEPGTFPTAKVIGGYDFVGSNWPNTGLLPDPDPLDSGVGGGHGTHVADIIAGSSSDGLHKGVAPGASLYAVKVCSSVATSCSGVALLQGMDFAMDPNGDGKINDAVDVINMSLGSAYGQREDDLSQASANAAHMGVVVVVSAGNSGDKPYIVGSPSSTPEVISVAQTQVPSSKLYIINTGTASVGGAWQSFSPAPVAVTGPLQYGNGAGGNLIGCVPFAAGSLVGKVVLVDRGTCAISIKGANVSAAGGLAAIVANNAAQASGDLPPDFSYGGGVVTVATYSITRADGLLLKTKLGQTATIDPASAASLVMNMVSTSSRGPSYSYSAIKPDVGAPGASMSAEYGTGNGQTAFGGTSGAAPMVSGTAALFIQAYPKRTPVEIKAMLMNTAETNIGINPVALPGNLAPITRIGGGEVRIDRAIQSSTAAWDKEAGAGSLSFGYQTLSTNQKAQYERVVSVHNYSKKSRTYTITPTFRYADDAASGAVEFTLPSKITVPGNETKEFAVKVSIDPAKLPLWTLNGGSLGGRGDLLQSVEFDGYIYIADAADNIHVAWQVLPHRASNVHATDQVRIKNGSAVTKLSNEGTTLNGQVDIFSLTGTSPKIPKTSLPQPGDNFAIIDLKSVGVRLVQTGATSYGLQVAINTYGTRAHPAYPAEFDVYIDTNLDGSPDFVIYNAENGGFGASGQTLVYVVNLNTGAGGAYYYADANLQSGNMIFTAPLAALGISNPSTQLGISVYAYDNYFTGNLTDAIEGMLYNPGLPRYVTTTGGSVVVPANGFTSVTISTVPGGDTASPSQTGLLLMYRDASSKNEAETVVVVP